MTISIITVALNVRSTVEDTITSVLGQTYKNIEYVIIDGGSTDGTLDIINKYKSKIHKFISKPDKGVYDGMNKGILAASGDIVGFLNADDVFYDKNVIQKVASVFTNAEVDCVYGNLVYVSRKNSERITRIWRSRDFSDGLFERSWTPAHPTFYCKKVLYERFGFYRTDFKIAADVELMYRFLQKNHIKSKYVAADFVRMRDSGVSSRGIQSTVVITREMKKAINENGGQFNFIKYLFFKFLKISEFFKFHGEK